MEYSGSRKFKKKNIRVVKIKFMESLFCNLEIYIKRGFSLIFGKYFEVTTIIIKTILNNQSLL